MLNEFGRRMDEHSGKVNKELIKYKEEPNRHKEYITQIMNTFTINRFLKPTLCYKKKKKKKGSKCTRQFSKIHICGSKSTLQERTEFLLTRTIFKVESSNNPSII